MPTVLVTGANRGIGLEFARQYAADGWQVIATCRNPAAAADLASIQAEVHPLDVADFGAIEALANTLSGRAIDVLVNNAGAYGEDAQGFGQVDMDDWAYVLRVNAMAPLMMAQAFVEHLDRGQRKVIASITSRMGSIADNISGGSYVYRSSKAALNAVVRSLAMDLRPRGIVCMVFHPGWVQTAMGGPNALISPATSIAGLRRMIDGATAAHTGRFFNYDGTEISW